MPRLNRQLPVLVITASLCWGFLLNGFFIYLPSLTEVESGETVAVFASLGWALFGIAAWFFGRNYLGLARSERLRRANTLLTISISIAAIATEKLFGNELFAWLLIVIAMGNFLALVLSRAVLTKETNNLASASAWLGAAPLIGSTVIALLLGSVDLESNFIYFSAIAVSVCVIFEGVISAPTPAEHLLKKEPQLIPNNLIAFGLALGLAVALANSFVYFRVSELGDQADLAGAASGLVLLGSVLGILASISVGLSFLRKMESMILARVGGGLVLLGVSLALLPGSYWSLLAVAALLGFGFGLVNGVELRLVRQASNAGLGSVELNAKFLFVTTLPYVFAPTLGQLLVGLTNSSVLVFTASAALSLVALLLIRKTSLKSQ